MPRPRVTMKPAARKRDNSAAACESTVVSVGSMP